MPLTDDYRLRNIPQSTAPRLKRVQACLNLVSIIIFREDHLLDVDECDGTTRDAIDIYNGQLRPMPAAEAPINAKSQAEALPP